VHSGGGGNGSKPRSVSPLGVGPVGAVSHCGSLVGAALRRALSFIPVFNDSYFCFLMSSDRDQPQHAAYHPDAPVLPAAQGARQPAST
jgi:hypothetical protein